MPEHHSDSRRVAHNRVRSQIRQWARPTALCIMAVVALGLPLLGEPFYTRLATRMLIYGMAAVSLDLILGFGGMVSLGHAAFLGLGAYLTGILSYYGVVSGFLVWPLVLLAALPVAAFIGAVSLRTSGAYFIMITLAFAQMLFFFFSSLETFGGDDGMAMWARNTFGAMSISDHTIFYYLVLALLVLVLFFSLRLVKSPFGAVIAGIRENERKMSALGYPVFRYKLFCFVLAALLATLAGILLANQEKYVSPAILHWTRSAEIMVMVILGGMGTLFGPLLGAILLLLAEEMLSGLTQHWMIILGPVLILVVLFARRGIWGLLPQRGGDG